MLYITELSCIRRIMDLFFTRLMTYCKCSINCDAERTGLAYACRVSICIST